MSKVRILGARLSTNPETLLQEHTQGLNGMVNKTVNDKLFYVVAAQFMVGLTPVVKSQIVWADANNKFALSIPEYNEAYSGKEVEGKLVTFNDVPAYTVEGKEFTHVTLPVFEGQSEATIVSAWIKRQQSATNPLGAEGATPSLNTSAVAQPGS